MAENHDPFGRPDATFIRPQPGGGRRAADGTRTRAAPPSTVAPDPIAQETRARLGLGLNPLVRAASPLLILAGQLRGAVSSMDVADLRRQTLSEIRQFETEARALGVPNDTIVAARYVLCATLDEAALATPWGSQSEWAQHPLLVAMHREAWGGEKFFEMLERMSANPDRYIDLMELQYLALALGFKGKYHLDPRGFEKLAAIQHELYRKIRQQRGASPEELSIAWRGVEDRRNPIIRYVPWWVVAVAALAIAGVLFVVYQRRLAYTAEPLQVALSKIGDEVVTPPPPPAPGPTLKQLLRAEEAAGLLTVTERGGESIVTLPSGDLFASASATLNPAHESTIMRVGAAINQLPGRVQVIGHTDDQPLKTVSFPNNVELSRARAANVVRVLQRAVTGRTVFVATGRGSEEPAYVPASDPQNRARNRRVEIHHRLGF